MRILTSIIATAVLLSACGSTRYEFQQAAVGEPEAQIPFVQYRTIRDWHADNDRQLFLQSTDRQWYQVDLFGPCTGLEYESRIRIDTRDPAGSFDRFSSIVLRGGERCKVLSVKKAPAPVRVEKPRPAAPKPNQA